MLLHYYKFADMAELADALDSGSSEDSLMQVQFLLSAPKLTIFLQAKTLDNAYCKAFRGLLLFYHAHKKAHKILYKYIKMQVKCKSDNQRNAWVKRY